MSRKPLTDSQRLARIERESAKRRQRIAEYEVARGREDIAAMARLSPDKNERARLRRRLAKGTTMPRTPLTRQERMDRKLAREIAAIEKQVANPSAPKRRSTKTRAERIAANQEKEIRSIKRKMELPAPPTVKRARKRIKTVKLTGDPFSALRKAAGIEKAKRTRHSKKVHAGATKLRQSAEFRAAYAEARPGALKARRRTMRATRGEDNATRRHYAAKDYRYALATPAMRELLTPKRKPRKKKSA